MKICIVVSSLLENDAIGNDICHQCQTLNTGNFPTVVFAENMAHELMALHAIDRKKIFHFIEKSENLLIYHQGGGWHLGQEILKKARCRIFIKYHNVTPPEFYRPYDSRAAKFCEQGLAQTRAIARLPGVSKFLCVSSFNARDLLLLDVAEEKIEISPPFHKLDDFKTAGMDQALEMSLNDGKINVLFVGRLVPNKGHKHMIGVLAAYVAMYGPNIRLTIVGGVSATLESYLAELNSLIVVNGLKGMVHIRGSVSFDELHTYYSRSHIFLLMSEHEGFCLPILEAQLHSLPVVALKSSAVPETLGPDQIVFDKPDYKSFAAAIHVIGNNERYRAHLAEKGVKNIERFSNKRMEKTFLNSLDL